MPRDPSGKFVIRLEPELHAQLRQLAASESISLNELCKRYISKGLAASANSSAPYDGVIENLVDKFGAELVGVVLFGSQARGDAVAGSDIDILVVLSPTVPIRRELYRGWDNLHEKISLHFSHLPQTRDSAGSLWLECALDGIILHDPSRKTVRMLNEIKELIASGKVIRKTTHGQGYWIHV